MTASRPDIYLYSDGAASPNPGCGGYGIVMRCGSYEKEFSGGYRLTTNNRMEMLGVIVGLEKIGWEHAVVHVISDSKYVVDSVIYNYKRKKNVDLWARLDPLLRKHHVDFTWIEGHAGHPENERCDRLAVAARTNGPLEIDANFEAEHAQASAQTGTLGL